MGLGKLIVGRDQQVKGKRKGLEGKKKHKQKLEADKLCTRSEIQKDEESRKDNKMPSEN